MHCLVFSHLQLNKCEDGTLPLHTDLDQTLNFRFLDHLWQVPIVTVTSDISQSKICPGNNEKKFDQHLFDQTIF